VGFLDGTRDIWARDYCPIQVGPRQFVKFRYYPDYLRDSYEDRITGDQAICQQVESLGQCQRSELILDGGNVVGSREQAIVTQKIFAENEGIATDQVLNLLQVVLAVRNWILIPQEPGDDFGHADGVVRFLRDELVAINDYGQAAPGYGNRLRRILTQHHLEAVTLPYFFENRSHDGIASAVGNYVNFLRVGSLVIVPAYGVPQDEQACDRLSAACPEATVVPLPCVVLAREGGALNCISWTIKA
jgi:agmatine deiminase